MSPPHDGPIFVLTDRTAYQRDLLSDSKMEPESLADEIAEMHQRAIDRRKMREKHAIL